MTGVAFSHNLKQAAPMGLVCDYFSGFYEQVAPMGLNLLKSVDPW
jgi:hypothetical protein